MATSAGDTKLGVAGSTGFIAVTAGMIVAGAVALGFARFFAGTPVIEQNLDRWEVLLRTTTQNFELHPTAVGPGS